VVVDNGSADETPALLSARPGVRHIRLERNVGAARAKNIGAAEVLRDPKLSCLIFTDNDTVWPDGTLNRLLELMERNPEIAALGPRARGAVPVAQKIPDGDDPRAAEWTAATELSGLGLVVRRSAWTRVGPFDERFGWYGYEDTDWCRRARRAGLTLAVANCAHIEHQGGATLAANPADWQAILQTAALRYQTKWSLIPPPTVRPAIRRPQNAGAGDPPPISVVLITHNRLDQTRACLESLRRHTGRFELIVVDNASHDGTPEYIRRAFPDAQVIRNTQNFGVAIARNQGIRAASYEQIVLLDNDITVSAGWLDDLRGEQARGADIVGIEAARLHPDAGPRGKCSAPTEAFDYLGGACCLFRRRVFEQVGLLDEGFSPAYYEDADLCFRARAAGLRLAWRPTPAIRHEEHATLGRAALDYNRWAIFERSRKRFLDKQRGALTVTHECLPPRNACRRAEDAAAGAMQNAWRRLAAVFAGVRPGLFPMFFPKTLLPGETIAFPVMVEISDRRAHRLDYVWRNTHGATLTPARTAATLPGGGPRQWMDVYGTIRTPAAPGTYTLQFYLCCERWAGARTAPIPIAIQPHA